MSLKTKVVSGFISIAVLFFTGCQSSNVIVKDVDEVRVLLQTFQDGYSRREIKVVGEFMDLFTSEQGLEVIGTGAVTPGTGEWCLSRYTTGILIDWDWRYWGDLSLDVEGAKIYGNDDISWLATSGTLTVRNEEDESGESVWPIRFTAVAVREGEVWRFWQMQFSHGAI